MDTKLQHRHINDLLDDYDVFLFDLWGVVIEDGATYPGVVEQINKIIEQKKVYFISNAPRPNYRVMDTLISFGVKNLHQDMIITSGDIARLHIEEAKIRLGRGEDNKISIYHLGADRNEDALHDVDHRATENLEDCDIFLLSLYRDDHEDIHQFNELLKAVSKSDVMTICSNPDTTIPKSGAIRYCAGYFANIVEQYGGNVIYTGKPGPEIYKKVFALEPDTPKHRILMIGDTFETDILGGQISGINSALVLTGNSGKYHNHLEMIDHKLLALSDRAKEINITPTIVTSLT